MAESTNTPSVINTLAFIDPDDGAAVDYRGPFEFLRDGGSAEITIPVDGNDAAGLWETTAKNLTDRVGDIGVAIADGGVESSGIIEAADIHEGDCLVIRINDGAYADALAATQPTTADTEVNPDA